MSERRKPTAGEIVALAACLALVILLLIIAYRAP